MKKIQIRRLHNMGKNGIDLLKNFPVYQCNI